MENAEIKYGIEIKDLVPIAKKLGGRGRWDYWKDILAEMSISILYASNGHTRSWYLKHAEYAGRDYLKGEAKYHLREEAQDLYDFLGYTCSDWDKFNTHPPIYQVRG